jgi:Flp pilus assembly protein TadG
VSARAHTIMARLGRGPAAHSPAAARRARPVLASLARSLRGAIAATEGAAVVEAAIVLPIFLLCVFGLTELGRALWIQSVLQYAVEEAARCAALGTANCNTTPNIQTYAASKAVGITVPSGNFTVTSPSCGKQVAITYSFTSVVPNLLPAITLSAQACRPA